MSRPKHAPRKPSLRRVVGTGARWFAGTMGAIAGMAAVAVAAVRHWTKPSAGSTASPALVPSEIETSEHAPGDEEIRYSDGRIEHPSVRYEKRDVKFHWIMAFLLGALCYAVIHFYVVWEFFGSQKAALAELRRSTYPLARSSSPPLPPAPRLEQIDRLERNSTVDAYGRRAAKEEILNSYGATGEKGFARIPIQEAMRLLAGQLPIRKEPSREWPADHGLRDAGEPNSGRMLRVPTEGERP